MTSTVEIEEGWLEQRNGALVWVNLQGVQMNTIQPPPALDPPTQLTATALVGSIRLNWQQATVANNGYKVYAALSSGGDFAPSSANLVQTVAAGVGTFTYNAPTNNEYLFKVGSYTTVPAQASAFVSVLATPLTTTITDWRNTPNLLPANGKVVFGLFAGTGTTLAQHSAHFGKTISLTRVFTGNGNVITRLAEAQTHLNNGVVPCIDINLKTEMQSNVDTAGTVKGTSKNFFQFIADGDYDGDLTTGMVTVNGQSVPGWRKIFTTIKNFTPGSCPSDQVILSLFHEMEHANESGFGIPSKNATTFGYFRAAWQHVYTLARSMGLTADHVLFQFCGNTGVDSFGNNMTDSSSDGFYPGHAYVDEVAVDMYNSSGNGTSRNGNKWNELGTLGDRGTGTSPVTVVNKWAAMAWWYRNFKVGGVATKSADVEGRGVYKPMCLSELGTGDYDIVNAPNDPTKRATTWFDNASAWLLQNPDVIRRVIYYNNTNNDVTTGLYRPGGFNGRGTKPVWAGIS